MFERYSLNLEAPLSLSPLVADFTSPALWQSRFNIAPRQQIPVLRCADEVAEWVPMVWGLVPWYMHTKNSCKTETQKKAGRKTRVKLEFVNVRYEMLGNSNYFTDAFERRRCLVPATGFYEWSACGQQRHPSFKQPYNVTLPAAQPFFLAAIWDRWDGQNRVAMLVRKVEEATTRKIKFSPIVVGREAWQDWLGPLNFNGILYNLDIAKEMIRYPISPAVNHPHHNSCELLNPVPINQFSHLGQHTHYGRAG